MSLDNTSGLVRRVSRQTGQQQLGLTELGNERVELFGADYAQLAKARRIYCATTGAGTAIAPVTAMPTTTATWALFNGEDAGGKSYALLSAFCYSVSGTLGLGMSLLGAVATAAVTGTKPTSYASSAFSSLSGGAAGASKGIFASAVTMVGTPAWAVLAARDQVSAISVGSGLTADVRGMLLIPPQYVGALTVLAPAGTVALFGVGFVWAELELDLE